MTSLHGRRTHRRGRWTETHLPLHGGNLEPPRLRYPGREQAGCNVAMQLVASPGVRHVVMGRSCLSTKSSCSMHSGAGGQSGPGPHCSGLPSCSRPAGDRRAMADPGGKEDHGQERDAGLVANRPPRRPSIGPVRWESIRQIPRTTMLEPVSTQAGPSATTSRCSCGFCRPGATRTSQRSPEPHHRSGGGRSGAGRRCGLGASLPLPDPPDNPTTLRLQAAGKWSPQRRCAAMR